MSFHKHVAQQLMDNVARGKQRPVRAGPCAGAWLAGRPARGREREHEPGWLAGPRAGRTEAELVVL